MNAIELLTKEHRDIEDLFDRLSVIDEPDEKAHVFEELARLLTLHALIERQHFYPAVKGKQTDELLGRFFEEHDEVDRILTRMLALDPATDDGFNQKLQVLQNDVEAHLSEEETRLFPQVMRQLTPEMLDALGDDMRATRDASSEMEPRDQLDPDRGVAPAPE